LDNKVFDIIDARCNHELNELNCFSRQSFLYESREYTNQHIC